MKQVLLLGIGNVLWADEGFGVRVIETLQKNYTCPENVHILDGGTQGLYLVEHVEAADILIIFALLIKKDGGNRPYEVLATCANKVLKST